jgi:ParB-like chromosome segregation protein Spo0J
MSKMKFHPLAEIFPLLEEGHLQELAADIRDHGLRQPIVTYQGLVLDGRNRLAACEIAGVEPRFEEFAGDNPLSYVISLNLARRHLTDSQRAMIAARIANVRQGERRDLQHSANLQKVSRADAARMLSVSPRSVASAAQVLEHGEPELIASVKQGDMSVSAAAKTLAPVEAKRRDLFELITDYARHYRQQGEQFKASSTVFPGRDWVAVAEAKNDAVLATGNAGLNEKIIEGIRVAAYLDLMVLQHFYWHDELVREALTPAMDTLRAIPGVADAIRAKMEANPKSLMTRVLA